MKTLRKFTNRFFTLFRQGFHLVYALLIKPNSASEDLRRREFILTILLNGFILLIFVFDCCAIASRIAVGPSYRGVSVTLFTMFVLIFVALLILARRKKFILASYLFIGMMIAVTTYAIVVFGAELPLATVSYIAIIVIASILISTRFGFFITGLICVILLSVAGLQIHHVIVPKLYWKLEHITFYEPSELAVFFLLIMTVSWLSNREIENSLRRARKSEAELKMERDSLEMKVEERTREIKTLQADKLASLYRSAELGKLSMGIFHDLMNPLTTVVSSVGELERHPEHLPEVKSYLEKAVSASRRLGDFLMTVRKQIQTRNMEEKFSLNKELREAVDVLKYRAREVGVHLSILDKKELSAFGNPLKFHQICVNLISNAIDACEAAKNIRGDFLGSESTIHVTLSKFEKSAQLKVTDRGCGVPENLQGKIFDSFFTTKDYSKGMGLGLSTTKQIVEKEFLGAISFSSVENRGSTFTILIPLAK